MPLDLGRFDINAPEELVPKAWRDYELLKCSGRPYIPRVKVDGRWHADLLAYGCGQCLFCRARRAAFKTTRLLIESKVHSDMAFLTLSYAPEFLPVGREVLKVHVVDFAKRLRWRLEDARKEPVPMRFDYVGEYGERFGRPHYHFVVFGAGPGSFFGGRLFADIVDRAWRYGFVDVKAVHDKSFAYIAKYQAKGLTSFEDPELVGRAPQFSGGSRRPGIGVPGLKVIADTVLRTPVLVERAREQGIVPHRIKRAGKEMFLGGDGMRLLRMMVGVPEGIDDNRKFIQKMVQRETYRGALRDFFQSGDAEKAGVELANRMTGLLKEFVEPYRIQREARERNYRAGSAYSPF